MFCARCGEEITVPTWINNLPYGYTCAEIIRPGNKKPKTKYFDVTSNVINVVYENNLGTRLVIRAYDDKGKKVNFAIMAIKSGEHFYCSEKSLTHFAQYGSKLIKKFVYSLEN